MKKVGFKKLESLGRITLPKEIRDLLGLTPGTPIEIYLQNNTIVIEKVNFDLQIPNNSNRKYQKTGRISNV